MEAGHAGREAAMWVRHRSPAGRWVLLVTVLGSGLVVLDTTVVNVALPAIGQDFGVSLTGLQWIVNAYTLTLAGLLLLGGSLGDRYGRRRLFVVGILWFAAASLLCAITPNAPSLIVARALQGIGAALLTPGSLAIIETTFHPEDRSAAIGAWSGLGGVITAIGPVVGGYLTTAISWRLIFFINLPLAAVAAWAAIRHLPESRDEHATGRLDYVGPHSPPSAWAGSSSRSPLAPLTAGPRLACSRLESAGSSRSSASSSWSVPAVIRCSRSRCFDHASSPRPMRSRSSSTARWAVPCFCSRFNCSAWSDCPLWSRAAR